MNGSCLQEFNVVSAVQGALTAKKESSQDLSALLLFFKRYILQCSRDFKIGILGCAFIGMHIYSFICGCDVEGEFICLAVFNSLSS